MPSTDTIPATATPFVFNRDYSDLTQVEPFLPEFVVIFDSLTTGPNDIAYNDDFVGRIPGIAGPDEATAIYLLQSLRRQRVVEAQTEAFLAAGGELLDPATLTVTTRFTEVAYYGFKKNCTGWATWTDARIVPADGARPLALLPKGKRSNGFRLDAGKVLVRR